MFSRLPIARLRLLIALVLLAQLSFGQSIVVNNDILPASDANIAPAGVLVNALSSNSAADLFLAETLQVTDAALANLTDLQLSNISLFQFANNTVAIGSPNTTNTTNCKTFPGDALWPDSIVWNVFDLLLGGALIKTVPYAAPCFDSFGTYNATKCQYLTTNWANGSYLQTADPTAVNAVILQGGTCLPPAVASTALSETNCTVGGYPEYAVAVQNVAQVQLAINLARNLNIRLVVKNTGHDFGAKSTGAGSLSIWTHNLKSVQFWDSYTEGAYTGAAFKLGAGLQAFEVYAAAQEHNVTVVGGEGQTVGVMGGYILGGGHSPLSSLYGIAADQVLSMEVVTADGRFLTASETSNADLFWALRGGGGSTYGVVTSLVVKAYPQLTCSTITFAFSSSPSTGATNVTDAAFWQGVKAYFAGFETYADAGNYGYVRIRNLGAGLGYTFSLQPWIAPGMVKSDLVALTQPYFDRLAALGIPVTPVITQYDDFTSAWRANFPLGPWGSVALRTASRLIPRANWADDSTFNATFAVIQSVIEEGAYIVGFNILGTGIRAPSPPDNAVNPAWRDALAHLIVAATWTQTADEAAIKAASDKLTFDWMQRFRDLTPGSGAYMSEADYIEPDFAQAFFGDKYARLLQLKKKYDPSDVFWAKNAVASEGWDLQGRILGNLPSGNSRLCRT